MAVAIPPPELDEEAASTPAQAILAGGCFWCVEAVYRALKGVRSVVSGYCGGTAADANYERVCSGRTGHAEAVRIDFDPSQLSYGRILQVFFGVAHDPTQKNRQGNDIGPQYRSAIFPLNAAQERVARAYMAQLDRAGVFAAPIVTTIEGPTPFYPAEAYHQDYAQRHPEQPYICAVARPKQDSLRRIFPEFLMNPGQE
jgi:peptide-methionine (S)-S-oxide reductase